MTHPEWLVHELTLVLAYLSSWTERSDAMPRFWKIFDFDVLNQLADKGLIADSRRLPYFLLNPVGSGMLAVLALQDQQSGFLLLEGVWAPVSLWALIPLARSGQSSGMNSGFQSTSHR
jgi:hypothetical protein